VNLRGLLFPIAAITLVAAAPENPVRDQSSWDVLLKRYVNDRSLVDYRRWKETGRPPLEHYLQTLAAQWPWDLTPLEEKSALINAYNALTIYWVIRNYPVESIWRTAHPFSAVRHRIDGRPISLNQIETRLRAMGDPRIHAALVCAARSCPPLRREAYAAGGLDRQLDDNTQAWLADAALNEFVPEKHLAKVSMIFQWYAGDFQRGGGSVEAFLARYRPQTKRDLVAKSFKIEYKTLKRLYFGRAISW
jgi:hypothetical protein